MIRSRKKLSPLKVVVISENFKKMSFVENHVINMVHPVWNHNIPIFWKNIMFSPCNYSIIQYFTMKIGWSMYFSPLNSNIILKSRKNNYYCDLAGKYFLARNIQEIVNVDVRNISKPLDTQDSITFLLDDYFAIWFQIQEDIFSTVLMMYRSWKNIDMICSWIFQFIGGSVRI